MNTSPGKTVSESATESEGLHPISHPTIVSKHDTSAQPEAVSQPSVVIRCDNNNVLARNTCANIQSKGNSGVDAPLTSALIKNSKSISSQDIVIPVAASKVWHEKKLVTEETFCAGAAAESAACPSPARSALEELSYRDDDIAASPPSTRLYSDSENESPRSARVRRNVVVSRSLESFPTPRAPMKPARVKSLNTLFPGKTRRRLDFDHL